MYDIQNIFKDEDISSDHMHILLDTPHTTCISTDIFKCQGY
jgi:hypothetical protein